MNESRLDFEIVDVDGLTVCRLLTEFGAGVVERHWDTLYRQPLPDDRGRNPYFTHGVNNNNCEEVAVYLGLAWALTGGRDRWAVPVNGLEVVRMWYGREDFELVRWDYRIDAEQADWTARDQGFTKATYPVDRHRLRGPTSPGAGRPAGVFPVRSRRELTDLLVAGLGDVWTTVVVFGVDPDADVPIFQRLRDRRRPTLRHVVGPHKSFAVVTIGADLGCFDSVLLAADGDHRGEFERVFEFFRRRIHAYEDTLDSIHSMDGLLHALDFLQGCSVIDSEHGLDNLHRWMVAEAPALTDVVASHLHDHDGDVLQHLLMADVARYVQDRWAHGDRDHVLHVLDIVDRALGAVDERLVNVVAVSFVEHFQPWLPASWSFIRHWPHRLRSKPRPIAHECHANPRRTPTPGRDLLPSDIAARSPKLAYHLH